MKIEKSKIEEILKKNIEEIDKEKLYPIWKLWKKNDYPDFLDALYSYLTDNLYFDDNYYSFDSDRVGFVRSKVIEWFGEDHGLAVIDDEYWLLSLALTDEGVKFWDISKLDIDVNDIEKAKKLVKLMSITEDIGDALPDI